MNMGFKAHPPSGPLLVGLDPETELGQDHLARFIDAVVDAAGCPEAPSGPGQPGYHPRMLAKVSMYAYSTGVHSSRRIEQNCREHLAYVFLARDDRPSYHTISTARVEFREYFESIWLHLLATASQNGITALGRIAIDSTKFRADCSEDLIIKEDDYDAVIARLREHLEMARRADEQEDEEGRLVRTGTGVPAKKLKMRSIVRAVGKPVPEGEVSGRMLARIVESVETLTMAKEKKLKHVSLSDPDARMMPIGARRGCGMGHAFEVAADSGTIVAGGTCNSATDTGRLLPLLEEAKRNDPVPVTEVVADSGYFEGGHVVDLYTSGLDVVVPDATTAGAMRNGPPPPAPERVEFTKIDGRNAYSCPAGNVLTLKQKWDSGGQTFQQYKTKAVCTGCPFAERCLSKPTNKHRYITVQQYGEQVREYLDLFATPEMRKAYYARGPAVETIFGFLRTVMQCMRWSVRGSEKIASEAELIKVSYQVRKVHKAMAGAGYRAA